MPRGTASQTHSNVKGRRREGIPSTTGERGATRRRRITAAFVTCDQITSLAIDARVYYPDCLSYCFSQSRSSLDPWYIFFFSLLEWNVRGHQPLEDEGEGCCTCGRSAGSRSSEWQPTNRRRFYFLDDLMNSPPPLI